MSATCNVSSPLNGSLGFLDKNQEDKVTIHLDYINGNNFIVDSTNRSLSFIPHPMVVTAVAGVQVVPVAQQPDSRVVTFG